MNFIDIFFILYTILHYGLFIFTNYYSKHAYLSDIHCIQLLKHKKKVEDDLNFLRKTQINSSNHIFLIIGSMFVEPFNFD